METLKDDGTRGNTKLGLWTERGDSHGAAVREQNGAAAFRDHEEGGRVIEKQGVRTEKSSFRGVDR